jgi:hypothetical protein
MSSNEAKKHLAQAEKIEKVTPCGGCEPCGAAGGKKHKKGGKKHPKRGGATGGKKHPVKGGKK